MPVLYRREKISFSSSIANSGQICDTRAREVVRARDKRRKRTRARPFREHGVRVERAVERARARVRAIGEQDEVYLGTDWRVAARLLARERHERTRWGD